jgi:small subunit ribosomal protein S6
MNYELMLLLKPLTNEDVKDKVFAKLSAMVKTLKGEVSIKDAIGKRLMSYEIKKFKEGYYLVCNLTLPASKLKEFKQDLTLVNEVLRFLIIDNKNL